jgi:hypothetical protein
LLDLVLGEFEGSNLKVAQQAAVVIGFRDNSETLLNGPAEKNLSRAYEDKCQTTSM